MRVAVAVAVAADTVAADTVAADTVVAVGMEIAAHNHIAVVATVADPQDLLYVVRSLLSIVTFLHHLLHQFFYTNSFKS